MSKARLVLLGILLMLVACKPSGEPLKQAGGGSVGSSIDRYVDSEAGVVCYTLHLRGVYAAIDCLPISETWLVAR